MGKNTHDWESYIPDNHRLLDLSELKLLVKIACYSEEARICDNTLACVPITFNHDVDGHRCHSLIITKQGRSYLTSATTSKLLNQCQQKFWPEHVVKSIANIIEIYQYVPCIVGNASFITLGTTADNNTAFIALEVFDHFVSVTDDKLLLYFNDQTILKIDYSAKYFERQLKNTAKIFHFITYLQTEFSRYFNNYSRIVILTGDTYLHRQMRSLDNAVYPSLKYCAGHFCLAYSLRWIKTATGCDNVEFLHIFQAIKRRYPIFMPKELMAKFFKSV
ncbi:competence protein ComK [Loigolactobacillus backii]|uniref:Uncharacterized protein n=1 Tax=Loigolactobacillus backii TaxID=375175 RepID=A0A192H1L4_9LACO|nr:competence protein ComK [Loigolactobacillus backii]ANK62127.1 hypothetical protein AYR53_04685 [Loigolactobacillus backii]ANK68678.1 hypothetical protein AYR56_00035 [Loigolactobacillus backii]MDA5386681.1 competence protein ComK [Loigolactobacillus backii]MDA5389206.1 competence protein ComK [Loigolactobacillus backii]